MSNRYEELASRLGLEFLPDTERPAEADLESLERQLAHRLPDEYKDFLRKLAFSRASGLCFRFTDSPNIEGGGVEVFFGIRPNDDYDLMENWEGMQGRVPEGLLPFADSPGGLLCLSLRKSDYGAVYWWGFEHSRPRDRELYFVAPTFHDFLYGLYLE